MAENNSTRHRPRTRKPRTMLNFIGVKPESKLSPNEKKLYKKLIGINKRLVSATRKNFNVTKRLRFCKKFIRGYKIEAMLDHALLNPSIANFFKAQTYNLAKKPTRYTLNNRILALAIYKRNPKSYRFLSNIFTLPSETCLRELLEKVPITPGISPSIFHRISLRVKRMPSKAKLCTLLFDEMAITPSFTYSKSEDLVEGFVDTGAQRSPEVADRVMVWMLRGIFNHWKQPVAYTFSKTSTPASDIIQQFKEIVKEARKAGLTIIASICDQGVNNANAIKIMVEETREDILRAGGEPRANPIIIIDGDAVVPLFDPPHLLKSMRNHFLTNDVKFVSEDQQVRVAKWSHIVAAHQISLSFGKCRLMPLISDAHLNPSKIKKKKLLPCIQVFSHAVASTLWHYSNYGSTAGSYKLDLEGCDTAHLCKFLDQLFDSINCDFGPRLFYKKLRWPIKTGGSSEQAIFWIEAIRVFESMQFIKQKPGDCVRPPVLDNFILTIKGFQTIREMFRDRHIGLFAGRVFNQDPLENFFAQVRHPGWRYSHPSCADFGPYFKSLLIKQFSSVHSRASNCEADVSIGALVCFKGFVIGRRIKVRGAKPFDLLELPNDEILSVPVDLDALVCMGGYLKCKVFPRSRKCDICRGNILHQGESSVIHGSVLTREYEGCSLLECNEEFIATLHKIHTLINWYLPRYGHVRGIRKNLLNLLESYHLFSWMVPCAHLEDMTLGVMNQFIIVTICNYFKSINRILVGKERCTDNDAFKRKMYDYYCSHRRC